MQNEPHQSRPNDLAIPAPEAAQPVSFARQHWSARKRALAILIALLAIYGLTAYIIVPAAWKHFERRHLTLDAMPRITRTGSDIPGDPLNLALVGTEAEVKRIMVKAKWYPADPLTLKSCLEIAEASVLKRPYDDAPVSNLYLWGRKQDLAFEQPVGDNPRQRHHVRFWRSPEQDEAGRPIWVGAATFDERVGLSHTTGQITHHIAAAVDTERNHVIQSLQQTDDLAEVYTIPDFHTVRSGKNGGGDPWHTDGGLEVGVIR